MNNRDTKYRSNYKKIINDLKAAADKRKALELARFFKTGPGQYGEGDKFIGVVVPKQRQIAKRYTNARIDDIIKLLLTPIHEQRLTALLILVLQFEAGDEKKKAEIFHTYLKHARFINNWDLVDLSAPKIAGAYLLDKPTERKVLYRLVKSKILWERRIAILTTYPFIKKRQFRDTLKISEILLKDKHDLVHKAVGWMLREIGKIDPKAEEQFLNKHYRSMPRTMLRYAIEKFPEKKRKNYLSDRSTKLHV